MPDILKKSTLVQREEFDPTNMAHLESLRTFIRTGNWGEIQFYPQLPYIEVPMTVLTAFASHALDVQRETDGEKRARLEAMDLVRPKVLSTAERSATKAAALEASNKLVLAGIGSGRAT